MEFIKPWTPISSIPEYAHLTNFEVCIDADHKVHIRNNKTGNYLKPTKAHEYLQLNLSQNGDRYQIMLHRLIAMLWIENPENKPLVDHDDGDSFNNKLSNLRWCTHSENTMNTTLYSNSTTGESNIHRITKRNRYFYWEVKVESGGVEHTKNFPRDPNSDIIPAEVIACRNEMLTKYHKDFSRLRRDLDTTICNLHYTLTEEDIE